ncbi:hypothetical protein EGN73_09920 [Arthrospiribacter ruber]|uniref:Uncharacterized protein n=2 Tax=Arthrospiribacter ruber TaxID=2487934 RepID=A0A951IZ18_9BACT|nr:hypothetical protein [Arthrospiribacter ruber]
MENRNLKVKWLAYAVVGFLVMGLGLSFLGDAIVLKMTSNELWEWFAYGSVALVTFFAGLSIFGQAVVFKTLIDRKKQKRRRS